jgi:hypothetical protein
MLTVHNAGELLSDGIWQLGLSAADFVILGIGIVLMFAVGRIEKKGSIRAYLSEHPIGSACLACALFAAVILFGAYGIGYDASQFIYNQF